MRKGVLTNVQLVSERRQGNKKVTRATGLEAFFVDAEALAVELQKRFACSTSVSEVPGKSSSDSTQLRMCVSQYWPVKTFLYWEGKPTLYWAVEVSLYSNGFEAAFPVIGSSA